MGYLNGRYQLKKYFSFGHYYYNHHCNHHYHDRYFFLSYAQNNVFTSGKKRTKLPELRGGFFLPFWPCLKVNNFFQQIPSLDLFLDVCIKNILVGLLVLSIVLLCKPCTQMKLGDRYLQMNAYKVMLMENIQSHIIFTLLK